MSPASSAYYSKHTRMLACNRRCVLLLPLLIPLLLGYEHEREKDKGSKVTSSALKKSNCGNNFSSEGIKIHQLPSDMLIGLILPKVFVFSFFGIDFNKN